MRCSSLRYLPRGHVPRYCLDGPRFFLQEPHHLEVCSGPNFQATLSDTSVYFFFSDASIKFRPLLQTRPVHFVVTAILRAPAVPWLVLQRFGSATTSLGHIS